LFIVHRSSFRFFRSPVAGRRKPDAASRKRLESPLQWSPAGTFSSAVQQF
jgi:hypothetical protein